MVDFKWLFGKSQLDWREYVEDRFGDDLPQELEKQIETIVSHIRLPKRKRKIRWCRDYFSEEKRALTQPVIVTKKGEFETLELAKQAELLNRLSRALYLKDKYGG